MHQEADHGTIKPGKRADLVLIDGKPDERIEDLWHVSRVWVSGREAPLGFCGGQTGWTDATVRIDVQRRTSERVWSAGAHDISILTAGIGCTRT